MKERINKLWHSMVFKRCLCFFTRNNPIHTNRYYYWFIEIVGSERYLNSPLVRNEWDTARYSFDKMYGLIAEWRKSFDILNGEVISYADLSGSVDHLIENKMSALGDYFNKIAEGVFDLAKASADKKAKQLIDSYVDIKSKICKLKQTEKDKECDSALEKLQKKIKHIEEIEKVYNQITEFYTLIKTVSVENDKKKTEENGNIADTSSASDSSKSKEGNGTVKNVEEGGN